MFEIVPSQWMKKCFEEIDFAFTDFQKATLIWNAPGRLRQEILDALEELSEDTRDETLRRQINERLNYEKKTFETFIYNQSGKYVYVVEDGSYYVLVEGEADWDRYLERIEEKNWYVDFSDIQMICYKLTESGIWSHEHINPLYLEVEFPTCIEDDPKRQALRYAMEALGDYLSHKSNGKEFCPDLVLKYARKYAEVCRKKSLSENMLEEAKKPEDIML